jgi:4-diphosphocytidyl-2-C-methyl-D-erythritol kinase
VPVCLAGKACFVGGVGESLAPAPPLPDAYLVLVNPGVPLPTGTVFLARSGPFSQRARWQDEVPTLADLIRLLRLRRNDLTAPACRLVPQINAALEALEEAGALLARLSGSGPTCFGLFPTRRMADGAAARIRGLQPAWWVAAAPLLTAPERFV